MKTRDVMEMLNFIVAEQKSKQQTKKTATPDSKCNSWLLTPMGQIQIFYRVSVKLIPMAVRDKA
jgi:hypothetical protein